MAAALRPAERPPRACVLGNADLALQCVEILHRHGHEIVAVASVSPRLLAWAATHGVPTAASLAGLRRVAELSAVDYLFSIIDPEIVPADVLRLPRRLAINYHNAPLPGYAGVYATSWAILRGEREHGVTWHVMAPKVNAGDVLIQVPFAIDEDETAFSLNVKCHEHAVEAFAELVATLGRGAPARRPQDLTRRRYFGAHRKVPGAGILCWQDSALDLGRMVRALTFGDSPNELGVARLQLGEAFYVPRELKLEGRRTGPAAGTLLAVGREGLQIATATEDVRLEGVLDLAGERLDAAEVAWRSGLAVGSLLPSPGPAELTRFECRVRAASPHEAFWRQQIKTAAPLTLEALGLAPMAEGGEVEVTAAATLPADLARRLHAQLPADLGLPEAMLAALLVELAHASGGPELSVGFRGGWEPGSGPLERLFVDHRVLTVALAGELTFAAAARRVARQTAEVARRGPFLRDIVLRHPVLRGSSCRLPVAVEMGEQAELGAPAASPPLCALVAAKARRLDLRACAPGAGAAEVRTALRRLVAHVVALLAAAAEDPTRRLSELPRLGAAEAQQVVREWNDTRRSWAGETSVPRLFEVQARLCPSAIAVVSEHRRLTYGELSGAAARLAAALRALGIGAGDPVAVHAPRSPELVVALLAVLEAGAVYVPLDPALPPARLLGALEDCGARLLLVGSGLHDALATWHGRRLELTGGAAAAAPPPALAAPAAATAPAYLMFTSGSTGRPKGVLGTHAGLSNRLLWALETCGLGPDDRVLQVAAVGFDVSVVEMLLPLCAGARLVIAAPERHRDPSYLVEVIREHGVTLVHFVPSLLRVFLDHPASAGCRTLVHAFSGGEALPAELADRFLERLPCRLHNVYGPTETSISVTHWQARRGERPRLGRPIANCTTYLLDAHLRPAPAGSTGELCIGGIGLALGYLGDPALTAERFIPDACGDLPGARLYRTGDLARWHGDGELDFLGRRDHQVKVRGHRVELGEVEALLRAQPGVREAVVACRETAPGEAQLVAYLRCEDTQQTAAGWRRQLRRSLLACLPEAMVPASFVFLAEIPLLPSGKVKLTALPPPALADRAGEEIYAAPRTPLERQLSEAWAAILAVPQIGLDDDVFSLGGHSLHATRMKLWLKERFGVDLPLRVVFEHPTVAVLAPRVEEACRERVADSGILTAGQGVTRFPLSFAQQRIWFQEQLLPGRGLYSVPMALALRGPVDVSALAGALADVVRRHDALASRIVLAGGEPMQERSDAPFAMVLIDLAALPAAARPRQALHLAGIESRRPFALQTGPLLRAWLLRQSAAESLLVIVVHHIAFDGWSAAIFWRELGQAYGLCRGGRPARLPDPGLAYGQFAAWQRQRLRGAALEPHLAFWERELAGAPALELPIDYRSPQASSHRGAVRRLRVDRAALAAARALAESRGATLFMVLLAAFQVLLHRLTGQEDLVVGTPFAGRSDPGVADLVGMFVNTVALRASLAGDPPFRRVLDRAREATLAAHEHQEAPFEQVVARLALERSPVRHPVFQAMLVLDRVWDERPGFDSLEAAPVPLGSPVSLFDLTLGVEELEDGLGLALEYATELFAATTIDRIARGFAALLAALAAEPEQPISSREMLAASERQQLLREWNDAAWALPGDLTVDRLFAAQAARSPDAIAVVGGAERLSYGMLDARANHVAGRLVRQGIGPESRVALLLPRGAGLIACLLGILKAGAAYVPLDPEAPPARVRALLDEAGAACLVTGSRLAAALGDVPLPILRLDADGERSAAGSEAAPPLRARGRNLAYVLYTSGSTGRPKGVLVGHRSLCNYVLAAWAQFELGPRDRVLQFASLSFDAAAEEIFPVLAAGGTLVLRDEDAHQGVETLLAACARHGVTVLDLPTAYFHLLAAERMTGALGLPSTLRLLIIGGERLLPERLVQWLDGRGPRPALLNTYGPTEATIVATSGRIGPDWDGGRGEPHIGRPVRNVEVRVLDAALQPVAIGVSGELCIGGVGIARGYLDLPAETAARFIPDPFSGRPGAVLYRTGDRARWRADGRLEYCGRRDRQVKLRGVRIEPAEVEAALAHAPAVRESAVVVQGNDPESRHLVAYVEAAPGLALDAAGLRRHCERLLPRHLVPARIWCLAALPRLISGKVDRRSLEADLPAGVEAAPPPAALRTPLERELAALWTALLSQPQVGAADDFFALGGHSLLAMRLLSRVRALWAVELPLRSIFDAPTLSGLAREIERGRGDARGRRLPPIGRRAHGGAVPLTPAQRRIYFLEQSVAEVGLYNVPAVYRLRGRLDLAALRRALERTAERHEALRAAILAEGDRLVQTIAEAAPPRLAVADLSRLPAAARLAHDEGLLEPLALRGFDRSRAPLWRADLLRLAAEDHLLLLTAHHLVADGWSMDLLRRDVAMLYEASLGKASAPPPVEVQYGDFSVWLETALADGELARRQLEYWREELRGAPEGLDLPVDRPPRSGQDHEGKSRTLRLPRATVDRLRAFGQRHEATLFMSLLSLFALLLHRVSGQDDLVVGTPISHRHFPGVDATCGLFLNTLPLRSRLAGGAGFGALLRATRAGVLAAFEHQDLPFERIVEALGVERRLDRLPLFQVAFTLDEPAVDPGPAGSLLWEEVRLEPRRSKFDLALTGRETDDEMQLRFDHRTALFDGATVERLASCLRTLLEQALRDPDLPLAEMPLLAPAERHQVMTEWNEGGTRAVADLPLHRLFELQAARTPHRPAVVAGDATLTYEQLHRRSDRLARRLRAAGVAPEVPVGVCLPRSADLVTAVLATWKCGGIYVPLDPANPRERLAQMIAEARIGTLITGPVGEALATHFAGAIVRVDGEPQPPDRAPLRVAVEPDGAAYICFTSGSTGHPKAVVVPHRGIANRVVWSLAQAPISGDDALLQIGHIGFDISLWEIFFPLLAGARLVIADEERARDPCHLEELIARERITVIHFVPTLLEQFLGQESGGGRDAASPLRFVVCGGEALSGDLLRRFAARLPARLCHAYGPTEASISVAHWDLRTGPAGRLAPLARVPIGRPLAGARLLVLDGGGQPVPAGVAGELFIGGVPLARGYLGRADLTADRFVPDPSDAEPGARLYRTGDWARHRPDGQLEFLGRRDRQVKIRGQRLEPAEVESALLAHPEVARAVTGTFADAAGRLRLAAWVVCQDGPLPEALATRRKLDLRRFLETRLPDAMVPSALLLLDRLPLLPTGKLDRQALPLPTLRERLAEGAPVAPRGELEARLAALWCDLLGLDRVGVHDNFFEIGGDSIAAIQLVSRARQAGIELDLPRLFRAPTVAELAVVATLREEAAAGGAAEDLPQAGIPLAPVQRRFFARRLAVPNHWNQALLLEPDPAVRPGDARAAVAALWAHHDALRLRFHRGTAGGWEQGYGRPERAAPPWVAVDLARLPEPRRGTELTARATEVQASLDLAAGAAFRAAWFDLGAAAGRRLLLVAHHLVVDAVSWRILLADLETCVGQRRRAERLNLPAKTISYAAWARAMAAYGESPGLRGEVARWAAELPAEPPALPLARPAGRNLERCAETVALVLPAAFTGLLLERAPRAYGNRVDEILVAALVLGFGDCCGRPALLLEIEGHGREPLPPGLDVARTVGWFTAVSPLWVELPAAGAPGPCLKAVKERMRRLPGKGLGFGAVRYAADAALADGARALPAPPAVSFNYLGPSLTPPQRGERFRLAAEDSGAAVSPANQREALLEIGAAVRNGCLEVGWTFSREQLAAVTVERLASRFRSRLEELVAHASGAEAFGYTPSDFPLAPLGQDELDAALGGIRGVEDVLPLAPMQAGFLFQSLLRPGTSAYFTQIVFELCGDIRPPLLAAAWSRVVERHTALRTSFLWQDVPEPLQVVWRSLEVPWAHEDWRQVPAAEWPGRLETLLEDDRRRGLCLTRPPLLRLALAQLASDRAYLVWSHQHILLDGWSLPRVWSEVLAVYARLLRAEETALAPAPPFRDYVAWLRRQDPRPAEAFWRRYLAGLDEPLRLSDEAPPPAAGDGRGRAEVLVVSAARSAGLRALARRCGVTLGTVVQGAWAFFLSRYTGRPDVVFGVSVSGRPHDLAGVEAMVGLLINTVPLRVRLADDEELGGLLAGIHAQMAELQEHAFLPLVRIQACSGAPGGRALFDSLVVFENYPLGAASPGPAAVLEVASVRSIERTEYPLTVTVVPGDELRIELAYQPGAFAATTVETIAGCLDHLLAAFAGAPGSEGTA
jgi:amino acid adenylation domain-containing protein/non-ribosomal peptide synthase protein (TIGR01720 family)